MVILDLCVHFVTLPPITTLKKNSAAWQEMIIMFGVRGSPRDMTEFLRQSMGALFVLLGHKKNNHTFSFIRRISTRYPGLARWARNHKDDPGSLISARDLYWNIFASGYRPSNFHDLYKAENYLKNDYEAVKSFAFFCHFLNF